jgi:hypothetical protein
MSFRSGHILMLKLLAVLLVLGTLYGCRTQPRKYRKKRGCDCPKWNLHQVPGPQGVHAKWERSDRRNREQGPV